MKNLLVFLLLLAVAGLFFHDKQQTTDLAKAQTDNAALTQQLQTTQAAFDALRLKARQQPVFQPAPSALSQPARPMNSAPPQATGLQTDDLNRPAYR